MKPGRRKQSDDSATRNALIEATQALLLEEGYAAVSSRRIGERAGVKPPLIHYYFATMDDLYLAVFRHAQEISDDDYRAVLGSERPLSALWAFSDDPRSKLGAELVALANHRPALREEMVAYGEQAREAQVAALQRHFDRKGLKPGIPPVVAAVLLSSLSHQMRMEKSLGISRGHEETLAYFEQWLELFDVTGAAPSGLDISTSSDCKSD